MMPKPLPEDFLRNTEPLFGPERFACFMAAMDEEPPVSIRVNPGKVHSEPNDELCALHNGLSPVPWCPYGFYLPRRPNFTFDPLLHAGCYYVQEAASQFIVHSYQCAMNNEQSTMNFALDLCAAPGGKSTALRTVLPDACLLVSNEPIRQRAQVLSENMQKWGHPNCVVTNCHASDFVRAGLKEVFDLIVCDVPCSGEGMFRKDPDAIGEWSMNNVARCWQLQRQIVSDIWPCLRPGGTLIYCTCTYNIHENEENVRWLQEQTDADIIDVPVREEWGITGSLLQGFYAPVYRFIPGLTRSEGLFMAVLRKKDEGGTCAVRREKIAKKIAAMVMERPASQPAEALSITLDRSSYPIVDLPYSTAIAYLRREAIVLPAGTPTGHVIVSFNGHPLGFVKNIGSRANNLYPREWAIRSTHVPPVYEPLPVIL